MANKITGKIYGGLNDRFWDCGAVEAYLAPKLNEHQYAYAAIGTAVYFCVVRKTGNMEWLSFCDAANNLETVEAAHASAQARAAACRYAA